MTKDHSKPSKTLIITDMYETAAEPLILGRAAIPENPYPACLSLCRLYQVGN